MTSKIHKGAMLHYIMIPTRCTSYKKIVTRKHKLFKLLLLHCTLKTKMVLHVPEKRAWYKPNNQPKINVIGNREKWDAINAIKI